MKKSYIVPPFLVLVAVLFALIWGGQAEAATVQIDTSHLSVEEAKRIDAIVNKPKETKESVMETINTLDTSLWEEKATGAANALIAFTSKIGVAARDFIFTGTGIVLIFIGVAWIIWDYIVATIWVCFVYFILKRMYGTSVEYEKTNWRGVLTTKTRYELNLDSDEARGWFFALSVVCNIPTLILIF